MEYRRLIRSRSGPRPGPAPAGASTPAPPRRPPPRGRGGPGRSSSPERLDLLGGRRHAEGPLPQGAVVVVVDVLVPAVQRGALVDLDLVGPVDGTLLGRAQGV